MKRTSMQKLRRLCNFSSLRSLGSLGDLKLHSVPFLQTLVPLGCNRAVANENVWAVVASDKTVAFSVVKPLHRTFQTIHVLTPRTRTLRCETVPCNSQLIAIVRPGKEAVKRVKLDKTLYRRGFRA